MTTDVKLKELAERIDWDDEVTSKLIKIYKQFPELWNQTISEYKEKNRKVKAFKLIAKSFDTSPNEVRRKVHNMRCQFSHELRKLKAKATKNNQPLDLKSDWRFFEDLSFLLVNYKDYLNLPRVSSTKANNDTIQDISALHFQTILQQSMDSDSDKEMNSDSPGNSYLNVVPKSEQIFLTDETNEFGEKKSYDDNKIFGEYIASELRALTDRSAKKLKIKIRQAILEVTQEEFEIENGVIEYLEF